MRIGLYPGTFDPVTNGHTDIIKRALKLVDRIVIGVARNDEKGPLFTTDERVQMLQAEVAGLGGDIVVQPFSNLLMHFAEELNANVIIRGLRAVADFEYEFQMTAMNQRLNQDIETVFLMADARRPSGTRFRRWHPVPGSSRPSGIRIRNRPPPAGRGR